MSRFPLPQLFFPPSFKSTWASACQYSYGHFTSHISHSWALYRHSTLRSLFQQFSKCGGGRDDLHSYRPMALDRKGGINGPSLGGCPPHTKRSISCAFSCVSLPWARCGVLLGIRKMKPSLGWIRSQGSQRNVLLFFAPRRLP